MLCSQIGSEGGVDVTVLALRAAPRTEVDVSLPLPAAHRLWARACRGDLAPDLLSATGMALLSIEIQALGAVGPTGSAIDKEAVSSEYNAAAGGEEEEDDAPVAPPRVRWRPAGPNIAETTDAMSGVISDVKRRFDSRAMGGFVSVADALAVLLDLRVSDAKAQSVLHGRSEGLSFADFVRVYASALESAAQPPPTRNAGGNFQHPPRRASDGGEVDDERRLRATFAHLDPFKEGRVSVVSLQAALPDSARSTIEMRRWVRERDQKGRGFVGWDDYVAHFRATGEGLELPLFASSEERENPGSRVPGYVDHQASVHRNTFEEDAQREVAIRRAFDAYDLNGDGLITYLELRTALARAGRQVSEFELRSWIKARDTSGNGGVSFRDFRRAYLEKHS